MLVGVLNSSIDQSLDIRPDYFCCASSEYCSKHIESSYSSSVGSIATLTGDMDEDNGLDSPVYEERVEERRHDRVEPGDFHLMFNSFLDKVSQCMDRMSTAAPIGRAEVVSSDVSRLIEKLAAYTSGTDTLLTLKSWKTTSVS